MQTYLEHSANTQTFAAQSSGTEVNNWTLDVEVGWNSSSLFPSMPSIALEWDVEENNSRSSFAISISVKVKSWRTCNFGSLFRCCVNGYKMLVYFFQKQCSPYLPQGKEIQLLHIFFVCNRDVCVGNVPVETWSTENNLFERTQY